METTQQRIEEAQKCIRLYATMIQGLEKVQAPKSLIDGAKTNWNKSLANLREALSEKNGVVPEWGFTTYDEAIRYR